MEAEPNKLNLEGRRIVDISYFFKSLSEINQHGTFGCGISDMEIINERQFGMISRFSLQCKICGIIKYLYTEDPSENDTLDTNIATVLSTVSTGCGQSQLAEQQAILNLPQMSYREYQKNHDLLFNLVYDTALEVMEEAGKEELRLAKEMGDVDSEGNGLISVIVDGAWCKRSYKVNYDASAGVVSAIYIVYLLYYSILIF